MSNGIYSQNNSSIKVYNSIVAGRGEGISEIAQKDIQHSLVFKSAMDYGSVFAPTPLAQMFVNPGNGDYNLISCSPAINNGSNSYFVSGQNPDISSFTKDLNGNARIYNQGTADTGAYEFQGNKVATPTNILYVKQGATGSGLS